MNARSVRIPLAEAENKLSELLDRVSRGEEITITRHDRAVAKLVSASRPSPDAILRSIEGLRQLRSGTPATVSEIISWKNPISRSP